MGGQPVEWIDVPFDGAAVLLLKSLLRGLPRAACRPFGRGLGTLAHRLRRRRRRAAENALHRAFPELDPAARRRSARSSFRHLGAAACDLLTVGRLDPVSLCRRLTLEGWEHLSAAEAPGRGIIALLTPFGLGGVATLALGLYRGPVDVLPRPSGSPALDRHVARLQTRAGNRLVAEPEAEGALLAALQTGGRVGLAFDRAEAPTPARLSLRAGAPIVPLFGYPAPRNGYRVVIRPAILLDENPRPEGRAIEWLTRRCSQIIEEEIRRQPELWPWPYQR